MKPTLILGASCPKSYTSAISHVKRIETYVTNIRVDCGFVRAADRRMSESQAALADAVQRSYAYVREIDAHGHWVGLAPCCSCCPGLDSIALLSKNALAC
jgi:hypothetical protein